MGKFIYISFLILCCSLSYGQGILENNVLKTEVNPFGKLFGVNGVEYPLSSGNFTFGESVVWLSAESGTDTFVSASLFGGNNTDFQSGPLSLDGTTSSSEAKWSSVYSINKNEIESHKYNYSKDNYTIPLSIENWQGNGSDGYPEKLAPFVDWNNNGQYEPTQGDYPYIYGDQMTYTVFNDRGSRGLTSGSGMGIQVESMVSVFNAPNNSVYSNVLINKMLLTNMTGVNYSNFTLSVLSKFILGDPMDNFIGTNVKENYVFCYNKGTNDAEYGDNIPVLIVFPLERNHSLSSTIYLNENTDQQTGLPITKNEFYNYSNGFWRNGKFIAYGGAGLDGVTPCKYVYSGLTDEAINGSDWTEVNVGNSAGNRNVLMNVELDKLEGKSNKIVSIAYAIMDAYQGDITKIDSFVEQVRKKNESGQYTGISGNEMNISVYPTIAESGDKIMLHGNTGTPLNVKVYSLQGELVQKIRKINNNSFILKGGLTTGFYYLEVTSGSIYSRTKLLIQ